MLSLLTSALLAGSAIALPTTRDMSLSPRVDSCGDMSTLKAWTVYDFDFHASYVFTTPAHQNSWGYVNFTLGNPVLDYRPVCSATSDQLDDFFYGTMTYQCDVPNENDSASFTYSRPSGALKINQNWDCTDARYGAQGGTNLTLSCQDDTWQNPDWKEGQIYSTRTVTCKKVTVTAPITEMSGVA